MSAAKHTPQQFEHDGFNSPREVEVAQSKDAMHTPGQDQACPACGHDVSVTYGPDYRFDPPCTRPRCGPRNAAATAST